MFLSSIFRKINSSHSHPFYYLSPNTYAVGNCAEEIYCGVIKAKDSGKKLVILYLFDLPFIFRYKLTNRALLSIESDYIHNPNKYITIVYRFLLTIVYIPLRLMFIFLKNILDIRLPESYSYPCIGRDELFLPNNMGEEFLLQHVEKHDWKAKFAYELDFRFKNTDKHYVLESIKNLGIPKGEWFVCIHVRESGFRGDKGRREYRNSSINNYLPAIQEIISRGGWVVRMGDDTMTPLPKMEKVIDYPFTKYKSDLMDLILIKESYFFIGCQSGIYDIAKMFNKPVLLLNMYNWTFGGPLHIQDRGVIKHVYSKKENRYISIKEVLNGGWEIQNMNGNVEDYLFIENSEDEILCAVVEYLNLLSGVFTTISQHQKIAVDTLRRVGKVIINDRLAPVEVMNDCEEKVEKYRIASQVIGGSHLLCEFYLKNNWDCDSLHNE